MASSYTTGLILEKQATGENNTTWGTELNTTITAIDEAISGYSSQAISDGGTLNLATAGTGATQFNSSDTTAAQIWRFPVLKITGSGTTGRTLIVPNVTHCFWIHNSSSSTLTISTATPTTTQILAVGEIGAFYCDGAASIQTLSQNKFNNVGLGNSTAEVNMLDIQTDGNDAGHGIALRYMMNDTDNNSTEYARVVSKIVSPTNLSETGSFEVKTMLSGTSRDMFTINSTEIIFNDSAVDMDYRIESDTKANALFMDGATGAWYINDSSNANTTGGLTINAGNVTDEILALKNGGATHGVTGFTETDTVASFRRVASNGGGRITGIAGGNTGIILESITTTAINGAPTTTSVGGMVFRAYIASGTNITNASANDNLFVFRTQLAGADVNMAVIDADGDLFLNATSNAAAFDAYDDVALVRAYDLQTSANVIHSNWDNYIQYNQSDLIEAGILTDKDHPMVNTTQLQRLHNGAIWQSACRIRELENKVAHMEKTLASPPSKTLIGRIVTKLLN